MGSILKPILLSLVYLVAVILAGFLAGSFTYLLTGSIVTAGIVTQAVFTAIPIATITLLHQNLADYGFKSANRKILLSIPISLIFSFPLAIVSMYLSENYTPPIALEDIRIMLLLAIVVSPIGEEVLFRGFIEGYLLKHTDRWIAIAMPALLFSAMHIVPYISAPLPALLLTLLGAFILGMLAGYYRAVYGSLIPAVIVHSVFNLSGIVVWLCL